MASKVLVTGASGNQGSAVARHLLAAKVGVNALVRSLSSPVAQELKRLGATLCLGSFDDIDSLKAAAAGTTAVFLNVSPTLGQPEVELQHAENIITAAKDAGTVTTIVQSSVTMTGEHESFPNWGEDYPMGWYWISKAKVESLVRSSGFKHWTILRPPFLMHNYLTPSAAYMFPELAERGVFRTAYRPDCAMMVFDADDVGKFAAAAILQPQTYDQHEIDLGVEALKPDEIARALSRASGKDIKTEFIPAAEASALSTVNPIITSQLWANDVGYKVDVKALEKYSIRLTTFEEYLEREDNAVNRTFSSANL